MSEQKPLYRWSIENAVHNNELEEWKASYDENRACAAAIEEILDNAYDDGSLNQDAATPILDRFGFNRVMWVLASTIRENRTSEEFSKSNIFWATRIVPMKEQLQRDYCVSHDCKYINTFTDQVRSAWDSLGLHDDSHCESEKDGDIDYTGKVLVLKPSILKDEYKTPEDQLFLAESGFGCTPNARGRKVFGKFLKDGEETNFQRGDFIGILKEEHLPEWAKERLAELQPPAESDGMTMGGM